MNRQPIIGIIGGNHKEPEIDLKNANEIGKRIANSKALLICGGFDDVMEAACKGAKSKEGTTIGVLPGTEHRMANKYIDIPIVTALKEEHRKIIARTADVVIALEDSNKTLSEVTETLKVGTPVVSLFKTRPRKNDKFDRNLFFNAKDPQEAIDTAMDLFGVLSDLKPKDKG